jgi:hypothetical protein
MYEMEGPRSIAVHRRASGESVKTLTINGRAFATLATSPEPASPSGCPVDDAGRSCLRPGIGSW